MHVLFRVDASLDIGTGHVMRCLALANGLREAGATCRFVSRAHRGHLIQHIREQRFDVAELRPPAHDAATAGSGSAPHAPWLGVHAVADAGETAAAAPGSWSWLVVDHYGLEATWEARMRGVAARTMVIDDLADRDHDCDLLLDQNPGRSSADYAGRVGPRTTILADPGLALLRPEFARLRAAARARSDADPVRILVSLGGVDRTNVTSQVLDGLARAALAPAPDVTVVLGATAPWQDAVRAHAARLGGNVTVLTDVRDMAQLMQQSDFAIGAAGTTALERCCLGLPAAVLVLAENQRPGARALHRLGAVELVDEAAPVATEVARVLPQLLSATRLGAMREAAMRVTDGTGVPRIVARLFDAQ